MMDRCASQTLLAAASAGLRKPAPLPPELLSARRELASGPLAQHTSVLLRDDASEVRMATIRSPKVDILTVFFYPAPACALPLYAMELVRIGPKPVVAVIDIVAPPTDPAATIAVQMLQRSHAVHADIANGDDPPDWYAQARSGHDYFVRPADEAELSRMAEIHLTLWRELMASSAQAAERPSADRATFVDFVAHYKQHHKDNSPGLPLMRRSFGEDWTRRYMDECFFA